MEFRPASQAVECAIMQDAILAIGSLPDPGHRCGQNSHPVAEAVICFPEEIQAFVGYSDALENYNDRQSACEQKEKKATAALLN